MKLQQLKEFIRLSLWSSSKIRECYNKSSQTPLPFIVGVSDYEAERWWQREFKRLMYLRHDQDVEFEKNKEERRKRLINLNRECRNGDELVVKKYATMIIGKFQEPLIGVELGSAYGGNVQDIAELWKGLGTYYGYDTFEGHPKQLGIPGFESDCMDGWYANPLFGRERLDYDYQRKVLDEAGADNAILVKGLVTETSCSNLKKIHLAFLDMDMEKSMRDGFVAVRDKIPSGGYLLLHDATPDWHIPQVHNLFKEILATGEWNLISTDEGTYIVVLEKK